MEGCTSASPGVRPPRPGQWACLVALLAAVLPACTDPAPPRDPTILLLSVDTVRPDYLSFYGYDRPTTPFLDALLADSFSFEQAYTPVPHTTPATASLLTGAYPHSTGVRTLTDPLSDEVASLTEALRAAGYQTRAVVTNQILSPRRRLNRGFEGYTFTRAAVEASRTTELALQSIESLDRARPAFVWVHYIDPHVPYAPPPELAERFDPGYEGLHRDGFLLEQGRAGPGNPARGRSIHRNQLEEPVVDHIRRLYAGEIRDFDDSLAPLWTALREKYGEHILLVFTADHGESLGEHDYYWDHGDYVYDATSRVPLAIRLPADHPLAGSGRCDGAVSLVDVVPTLIEVLDLPWPERLRRQVEGRSLAPCFRGEDLGDRAVFLESGTSFFPHLVRRRVRNDVAGRFRAVVHDDWKLIWTPFQTPDREWELYDLRSDPAETRNLYRADHPRVADLRHRLEAWLEPHEQATRRAPIRPEDEEALRALGYIE